MAKEFGLLERRTRGSVGNTECCCWVVVSMARLLGTAVCSEDAGLDAGEGTTTGSAFTFEGIGACERTTDDAIGLAFTLKSMSACEGTTDDAIGLVFTFKGTAAFKCKVPIRGELDGLILDAVADFFLGV